MSPQSQWGAARRPHNIAGAFYRANAQLFGLLLFFFAAYWQQGISNVWSSTIQPSYIRSFGIRYEGSGLINTVRMLPWWAKIAIALPQDRFSLFGLGHRLPYAFLGLVLGLATLASFPYINPVEEKDLFFLNTFLCALGVATADAAADGMAVDHSAAEHGAIIQGVMSSGSTIGSMLGSAVTGALIGPYGRRAAVWWLVAAFAVCIPTVFLTREHRPPERGEVSMKVVFNGLWASMRQTRFIALAAFIMIGQLGNAIASQPLDMDIPVRFAISDTDFAYMQTIASIAGLLGAVGVAAIFDRVEKKYVLAFESVFYVLLNYAPLMLRSRSDVQAFWFFNAFIGQVHFVATSRLMVLYAEKFAGATFFAVTASLSNFSLMAGTALGGALAERYGPEVVYILGSTVNVFMLIPIAWLDQVSAAQATRAHPRLLAQRRVRSGALADPNSMIIKTLQLPPTLATSSPPRFAPADAAAGQRCHPQRPPLVEGSGLPDVDGPKRRCGWLWLSRQPSHRPGGLWWCGRPAGGRRCGGAKPAQRGAGGARTG